MPELPGVSVGECGGRRQWDLTMGNPPSPAAGDAQSGSLGVMEAAKRIWHKERSTTERRRKPVPPGRQK